MASRGTRWDMVTLALTAAFVVGLKVGKVAPLLPLLEVKLVVPRVVAPN
ncbi:MAG: hypothetical protein OXE57_19085 [Alphaproteobacteria bacterium]|nr:hypothetical protein [Alphaproteobacteria bacterium]